METSWIKKLITELNLRLDNEEKKKDSPTVG